MPIIEWAQWHKWWGTGPCGKDLDSMFVLHQHGAISHLTHVLTFLYLYTLIVIFENYKSQRIAMTYVAGANIFIQSTAGYS